MEERENATSTPKSSVLSDKMFMQSITVSILGMVLCMVALCSASWAWFTTSLSSPTNTIRSATCDITVTVESDGSKIEITDGKFLIAGSKEHIITISAEGSAKSSYCILVIDGKEYYTEQISTAAPDNEITFELKFDVQKNVEIINRWGISSKEARELYNGKSYLNMAEQGQESATVKENE